MTNFLHRSGMRIAEAERLIGEARAFLDHPEEEIVVNYLDHAVEALRIVADQCSHSAGPPVLPVSSQAMATTAGRD